MILKMKDIVNSLKASKSNIQAVQIYHIKDFYELLKYMHL